jgi:hypothetical protein
LNNEDKEFFKKVKTKKVIKLPYTFTYKKWTITISLVPGEHIMANHYFCLAKHRKTRVVHSMYYSRSNSIKEVFEMHKFLLKEPKNMVFCVKGVK